MGKQNKVKKVQKLRVNVQFNSLTKVVECEKGWKISDLTKYCVQKVFKKCESLVNCSFASTSSDSGNEENKTIYVLMDDQCTYEFNSDYQCKDLLKKNDYITLSEITYKEFQEQNKKYSGSTSDLNVESLAAQLKSCYLSGKDESDKKSNQSNSQQRPKKKQSDVFDLDSSEFTNVSSTEKIGKKDDDDYNNEKPLEQIKENILDLSEDYETQDEELLSPINLNSSQKINDKFAIEQMNNEMFLKEKIDNSGLQICNNPEFSENFPNSETNFNQTDVNINKTTNCLLKVN